MLRTGVASKGVLGPFTGPRPGPKGPQAKEPSSEHDIDVVQIGPVAGIVLSRGDRI
jgi:hypothetical protein